MAIKIGQLLVDLAANTAAFQQDMTKAVAIVNSSSAQMNRSMASLERGFAAVGTAARAFGVGLSMTAIAAFAKRLLDAAGALSEQAEQLGVTVRALQGYQFAAGQSGVKAEQLEAALSRLTRQIGEAADGSDEAIKAFRSMGVGVLDAGGKVRTTEAVLRDIADRMAAAPSQAERARIAFEAFGKSGQKLIPMLSSGSAGLDDFLRRAERLGLVLGDDVVANADRASDALVRNWDAALKGSAATLEFFVSATERGVNSMIGDLQRLGSAYQTYVGKPFENFVRRNLPSDQQILGAIGLGGAPRVVPGGGTLPGSSVTGAFTEGVSNPVPRGAQSAIDKLQAEQDDLRELIDAYASYYKSIHDVEDRQKGLAAARAANVKAGTPEYDQIIALAEGNARLNRELQQRKDREQALQAYAAANSDALIEQSLAEQQLADAQERVAKIRIAADLEQEIADTQRLAAAVEQSAKAYEIEGRYLAQVNAWRRQGLSLGPEEEAQLRKLAERQVEASRELEQKAALMDSLATFGERAWDRIGGAMTEALVTGKGDLIDLGNIGRAVVSELIQEFMKLAAINPFKNWAFGTNAPTMGGAGNLFGGLFSMFGSMGGASAASTGFASASAAQSFGMAFIAEGTHNAPRGWAWVGEEGPELMRMAGGEAIASNQNSLGGGGDGGTYYIDNRGADAAAVARLEMQIRQLHGSIEPRAVAAVMGERIRGGGMKQVFR